MFPMLCRWAASFMQPRADESLQPDLNMLSKESLKLFLNIQFQSRKRLLADSRSYSQKVFKFPFYSHESTYFSIFLHQWRG